MYPVYGAAGGGQGLVDLEGRFFVGRDFVRFDEARFDRGSSGDRELCAVIVTVRLEICTARRGRGLVGGTGRARARRAPQRARRAPASRPRLEDDRRQAQVQRRRVLRDDVEEPGTQIHALRTVARPPRGEGPIHSEFVVVLTLNQTIWFDKESRRT